MRALVPLLFALALAVPVWLVVDGVDDSYEATASVRIVPLLPTEEVDRLHAAAGLPQLEDEPDAPFVPGGSGVVERVTRRVSDDLGLDPPLDSDDVRVLDTAAELVFPKYKEPIRRLKVKALDEDPGRAARVANEMLDVYLAERQQVIATGLERARRRLAEAPTTELSRVSLPLRAEAAEAASIAIALSGALTVGGRQPARPPDDPILPHPLRDALVAGLIGALAGWLLLRWRGRQRARRAPAAAAP